MNYYDEEFKPWEIVDGRAVVADESEWGELMENCAAVKVANCLIDNPPSYVVKATDIFEDVECLVVNSKGEPLFHGWHHAQPRYIPCHPVDEHDGPVEVNDLLTHFFQTVYSTPHVYYLIVTRRPDLVRSKWPKRWVRSEHEYQEDSFDNVILATYVETQSDIEQLVPDLLKCHDLCKRLAVVCNPKEELCFQILPTGIGIQFIDPLNGKHYNGPGSSVDCGRINLIIVEGNEHPMHPDWLRSLQGQCLDANVEFHLASWGAWVPRENCPNGLDDGKGLENLCHYETHEGWVSGLTTAKNQHMVRVGKDKSGRLLDGVEHNGRL